MLPSKYQLDNEMSGTTFRELAKLANFEKDLQIDTLALAQFCEVSEATIKRWIKHQTPTKPMIKLLKLKILLINQDEIITGLLNRALRALNVFLWGLPRYFSRSVTFLILVFT